MTYLRIFAVPFKLHVNVDTGRSFKYLFGKEYAHGTESMSCNFIVN